MQVVWVGVQCCHMLIEPLCRLLRRPRCRLCFPRYYPLLPPPSRLRLHRPPLHLRPPLPRPLLPHHSPTLGNGNVNGKCALQHLSRRPIHTLLVETTIHAHTLKALNTDCRGLETRALPALPLLPPPLPGRCHSQCPLL